MFKRVEYKKAAKEQLKGRWSVPVLSTLLTVVLAALFSGGMFLVFADKFQANLNVGSGSVDLGLHGPKETSPFSFLICFVVAAFVLAQRHVLDLMSKDPAPVSFSDFVDGLGQWWQAVRGFVWKSIWVFLWSLLFYIPGIVKSYSYSMMFYVMAEYPKIGVRKAMNISKELTRGYKGDLFVTDLSFIPLLFLCVLSMGIGLLWFIPYYQATYTNIYHALKQIALDSKRISQSDFE